MWSVLKKKMTKSGGYEMSDRESDSGDDCVVVLKKYTKIPSYAEGLSQQTASATSTTSTTTRYENPYEIEATPPTTTTDSNETTTSDDPGGSDQGTTRVVDITTTRVVDNDRQRMDRDARERTSRDIENNNHEEADEDNEQGFGARYGQNEDENANGGGNGSSGGCGGGVIPPVASSRTLSDLRLDEATSMRGSRLSPPRMKRREKPGGGGPHVHEMSSRPPRLPRGSLRVNQAEGRYQNLQFDPRRPKKCHAPPPPPPPPPPRDFLSSTSEDETRSRSNSRLPKEFPTADSYLYDIPPPPSSESITCPPSRRPETVESGYLTLEDVKEQLERAREAAAANRYRGESDGRRSNDSRYDGGSEITSEAEGRDSEPNSVDVNSSPGFVDASALKAVAENQPGFNWKSPKCKFPNAGEGEMAKGALKPEDNPSDPEGEKLSLREPGKLQPTSMNFCDRKQSTGNVADAPQSGRQSIEGPSSGGSTMSAPEADEKRQETNPTNFHRLSLEAMTGENDAESGSAMRVDVLRAAAEEEEERKQEEDATEAADIPNVSEPTHMSWDELMQEAQILGIPLYRPAASLCRSDSDRRSSVSSSATSSDLSHASPLQSPKTTARLTGSGGQWHRKDNSLKRAKDCKPDKKSSPFKGKFKLQNLFAAKKAGPKKPDREPMKNLRESKPDPIPFRASRLREFVRSGLESPVLQHYRSGPPCLMRSDLRGGGAGQALMATDLSSENGFRNSTISLRSHVLSSSYSSGSLGSVFSRSSSQTPSSSTSYGKTSASVESPGSSTGTSGSATILQQTTGHSSPPVVLQQSVTAPGAAAENWFPHVPPSANFSSCGNTDFMIGLRQLKTCGWYWGPLGWEEAGMKLTSLPDGSFLVRDSSDDRYILSLSFRSQGLTHHTRIEHYKGVFSFYSQPRSHAASNIVDFIEKAMEQSRSNQYLYFLRPRVAGLPPVPVQLLYPVSRFVLIPSLKHICRMVISGLVPRRDLVDQLPLTSSLRRYIKESH